MLSWDDHYLVLTLAQAGTVAAAARKLGVNETTVARRLAAVESAAGTTLFRRVDRRLVTSHGGRMIVAAAEAMERALAETSQGAAPLRGTVRVSSMISLIEYIIAPRLSDFAHRHPGLIMELVGGNATASLVRREADVAIRLERPARGKLVGRRLGRVRFRLAGLPDAMCPGYIAYDRDFDDTPEIRAVTEHFGVRARARIATLSGVRAAAEAGVGAAMLPDWMIAASPTLAILDPAVVAERPLWLVAHEDMKDRPAVRAVLDWFSDTLASAPPASGRARENLHSLQAALESGQEPQ